LVLFVLETVVERVRVTVVDVLREGLIVADQVNGGELAIGVLEPVLQVLPEPVILVLLVPHTVTERVKGWVVAMPVAVIQVIGDLVYVLLTVTERVKGWVVAIAVNVLLTLPERVKGWVVAMPVPVTHGETERVMG